MFRSKAPLKGEPASRKARLKGAHCLFFSVQILKVYTYALPPQNDNNALFCAVLVCGCGIVQKFPVKRKLFLKTAHSYFLSDLL